MRKLILILMTVALFSVACTKTSKQTALYQKQALRIMKTANLFKKDFKNNDSGLARLFAENLDVKSIDKNVIILNDNSIWKFISDGKCNKNDTCKIIIKPDKSEKTLEIPIKLDNQKHFVISNEYGQQKGSANIQNQKRQNVKTDREKALTILTYSYGLDLSGLLEIPKIYKASGAAKYLGECKPYSQEYTACLAKYQKMSTRDNISVTGNTYHDYTTNQHITFHLDGKCINKQSCYAEYLINNKQYNIKHITIPLKIYNDNVVTYKTYTMSEFKKIVAENKKSSR